MVKWDEWKEVSLYRNVPQNNDPLSLKRGCSAMAFLPDSKQLVSGTHHGMIKLHGIPDLKVIASIKAHTDSIKSMRTVSSCKGKFVLTCSKDHWIKVVQVGPQSLTVIAQYCNAVEPLCISGFIDSHDILYIHAGDTGGLLNVIKVGLTKLTQ